MDSSLIRARRVAVGAIGTLWATLAAAQGMFTHQIPIKLPKGVNGMQPDLALAYTPGSGNGTVGMGWRLAGLSHIARVNYGEGIRYAGTDTYAHSQLGVLVRQADGTYRSKTESFTKFVPGGTCGDGPCEWVAYDRSGVRYRYGTTDDSRIRRYGLMDVHTWALHEVVDPFGNSYRVTYWATFSPLGEMYPTAIEYTIGPGVPAYRRVELEYESRNDAEVDYSKSSLVWGELRLKWITVKSNSYRLRKYRLDYSYGTTTGRSQLVAVQECGTVDSQCLPAQTFEWEQGGPAGLAPNSYGQDSNYMGTGSQYRNVVSLDYDGDGKRDLFFFDPTGGWTSLMRSNGPAPYAAYTHAFTSVRLTQGFFGYDFQDARDQVLVLDYDGDGKDDLFFYRPGGSLTHLLRSNGDGQT